MFAETESHIELILDAEQGAGFSGVVLIWYADQPLILRETGVSAGTRFCIASLGKQFTASAALKCVELGLLELDVPIGTWISGLAAGRAGITVRQLLSHTSGWPQSYIGENHPDRDSALAAIRRLPLSEKPGARFQYSNVNYQIAAALVELVTGETYWDFVDSRLFTPAGLCCTGQIEPESIPVLAPVQGTFPDRLLRPGWGQQGYVSTGPDLFHWYRAVKSGNILSQDLSETLFKPLAPIREGSAALGWFIGKTESGRTRIFSRGNEDFGANALLYAYPDLDAGIIVLTHAGNNKDGTPWSRAVLACIEPLLTTD